MNSLRNRFPFLHYVAEYGCERNRVFFALLLAGVKHSPVILLPIYIQYVIDFLIPARATEDIWLALLGMTALILVNITVHPLYVRLYSTVRREVALRYRARLCRRIQQMAFAYHDRESPGRLHSKVMQDVEKLDRIGQILIDPLAVMLMSVVASAFIVVWTQPKFALILLAFLPVVYIQNQVLRKKIAEQFTHLRTEQEKLNAEVNEMLTMLPVSRAHATEGEDLRKIHSRLEELRNRGVGADWLTNILQSQIWGSSQMVTIAVVNFGALLVIANQMTVGEIVMFLSLVNITIGGLSGLLAQMVAFYEGNEAVKSINEILAVPEVEMNEGKPEIGPIEGRIEFRNVWFTYPGCTEPVLRAIGLDIEANQTIALAGPSGGGKTTMMKLLLGFYHPTDGDVLIDGRSLSDIDMRSFRRQVGIVTQDTFLFNGSVLANLTHGLNGYAMEDVRLAAENANALEFIEKMPEGFDTEIGERGVRLSGGQKQRLAIARAMLRKPRLLLLDEATSALDSESEKLVQGALERLMRGRTAFVIAHRLSTIRNADRILVFENGRIAEDGSHEELLGKEGVYRRMVELQSIG